MRICFLGDAGSPHLVKWLRHAEARGFEPVVLSSTPADLEGVKVEYCRPQNSLMKLWREQLKIIDELRPDILHVHFVDQFSLVTQWKSLPTVLTPWGSDVYAPFPDRFSGWKRLLKWFLLRRTYHRAAAVTSLSPHMSRTLRERFGLRNHNHYSLGFGRQEAISIVDESIRTEQRRCWGAGADDLVFFSPRACRPLYNIAIIVDAFLALADDHPDVYLWVSKFNAEEKYLKQITQKIESSVHKSRVLLLDECSPQMLNLRLASVDAVVSIPDSDGRPGTVIDALLNGIPVIYKLLPALKDLLQDEVNGFSAGSAGADDVRNAMERFSRLSVSQRTLLKIRCRDVGLSLPSEQEEMDRMAVLYRKISGQV
jgi:glycosyltransferase involved in cell wall biosynthesis